MRREVSSDGFLNIERDTKMSRLTRRGSFQFDNSQIEEKGIYVKDGNGEEIFFAEYEEAYPAIEKLCSLEAIS